MMRTKTWLTVTAAVVAMSLASPAPSHASGDREAAEGSGRARPNKHYVTYPRYVQNYQVDPYAYRFSPRGYYPYYAAGYWASSRDVTARKRLHLRSWNGSPPKYYKSWGYPRRWQHQDWHDENHGFHHFWQW